MGCAGLRTSRITPSEWITVNLNLILADYVRIADGKLDVLGGGWETIQVVDGFIGPHALGIVVEIPFTELETHHTMTIRLLTNENALVFGADGEPIFVANAEFWAEKHPGISPGYSAMAKMPLPIPQLPVSAGRYKYQVEINNHSQPDWEIPFTVFSS